ncbi:RNA methyltransferase [Ktedonobacter robiniae]|uniref:rRNA methyltransferase n=1 Tax=Ktedonobacter robiniae TaxID=2778365 RepID=A0ABQ3UWS2_9CHLR|nr:RNA methyltransferase [Ktedonobacter robiniae]GHO56785.1 rRNA methyltransferase [Ktedonobacter robiniae]
MKRPNIVKIYSENNQFQYIETLRRKREKRLRHKEFFIEGVRPINQALAHHWTINAFVYSREKQLSDWAKGILARSQAQTHFEVPLHLLEKLSNKAESSELLALIAMPEDDLARIPLTQNLLVVVFDRPASPGNLGTIIRSCDALEAHGLILTGHAVDLYDPETISASTGSFFALPTVRLPSQRDIEPWLQSAKKQLGALQIIGTDEKAELEISQHDFTVPTVLVVGNETWGMSAAYKELCDAVVQIPLVGSASSLNVACATSICLYEVSRQRRLASRASSTSQPNKTVGTHFSASKGD